MGFGARFGPFRVGMSRGRIYGGVSAGPFSVSAPLTGSRRGRGRARGGKEATSGVAGVLALIACCCCVSPIVSSGSDEPERTPRSSAPSATRSLAPSPTAPSPSSSASATAKPSPTRTATEAKPKPSTPRDPRFGTCKEAKAHGYGPYYKGVDPEYEWYRDRDGDGIVCE